MEPLLFILEVPKLIDAEPPSKLGDALAMIANNCIRQLLFLMFLIVAIVHTGSPLKAAAEDIEISVAMLVINRDTGGAPYAYIDISWENSWYSDRNNDAAWVFLKKLRQTSYSHARVSHVEVVNDSGVNLKAMLAADSTGFWIEPASAHSGRIAARVRVTFTSGDHGVANGSTVSAFAIEMVRIPSGAFYAGDPSDNGNLFGAFYQVGKDDSRRDYYELTDESPIEIGPGEGSFYYGEGSYLGDRQGPLPQEFPKGVRSFYIMKYEMTQGQYASMLNTISDDATFTRVNFGGRSYYNERGTISLVDGRYVASSPNRPMNFATWDDQLAFADWAALRPMTELEFEKAARGPARPGAGDFPWGTSDRSQLARMVDVNDELVTSGHDSEAGLTNKTLAVFGASYYRVMDLAGSVWERTITVGSPDGRRFKGTHGDGELDDGGSTNEDWPRLSDGAGGHGYRGGGFYGHQFAAHEFNPYSPVGYRRFGAWSGGSPHRAYGFRAVRTAPER